MTRTYVQTALDRLATGHRLGESLVADAFGQVMRGEASPVEISALLVGLRVQGETGEEIAGAVRAMRGAMVRVPVNGVRHMVDTCGTGGGAVPTFNISTAAALVATAAGATVAKHGNRSFTSRCGSADVLEALGIQLSIDAARAAAQLGAIRIAFLFAPSYHPAMKHVGPVRKELGIPTIMNLLGPLSNPAGVTRQVVGVSDPARGPLLAEALRRLGAEHALVVHAEAGMDEIAPRGPTAVWEVRDGLVTTWTIDPAAHGLEIADLGVLKGGEPGENASRIRALVTDKRDKEGRAAVLLNAAAAIYVAGLEESFAKALRRATAALDDGEAAGVLDQFIKAQAAGAE